MLSNYNPGSNLSSLPGFQIRRLACPHIRSLGHLEMRLPRRTRDRDCPPGQGGGNPDVQSAWVSALELAGQRRPSNWFQNRMGTERTPSESAAWGKTCHACRLTHYFLR